MIGKNVAPGVTGGTMPLTARASNGALGASDIDSATGAAAPGGDIPWEETNVAMARTLGVALGIPGAALEDDFIAGAGGKVMGSALV
jgi:hypothetical protein